MSSPHRSQQQKDNTPKQIQCGGILHTVAIGLNQSNVWTNLPILGASVAFFHHAAVWIHSAGKDLSWLEIGAGIGLSGVVVTAFQQIRSMRGPVVRRLLRSFVIQRMSEGKTYHLALGVNNGGDAVKCAFVDEWNTALEKKRPEAPKLRGDMIECTDVVEVDGNLQTHPDMERIRALRKKADRYSETLAPDEKLNVLVICDESRSGDTINRLLKRLVHPNVEIEVLVIIRREDCRGKIDWYFIESNRRHLLPCAETPKIKRVICPLHKRRLKCQGDDGFQFLPAPLP